MNFDDGKIITKETTAQNRLSESKRANENKKQQHDRKTTLFNGKKSSSSIGNGSMI